jgi:mRNA interferase MazF
MRRGDLVMVALPGDLGKPRPALVIQSDLFAEHPSTVILPVTGELRDVPLFRVSVNPTDGNGLTKPSQIMIDKPQSVSSAKLRAVFGRVDDDTMLAVNRALAVFLGFA